MLCFVECILKEGIGPRANRQCAKLVSGVDALDQMSLIAVLERCAIGREILPQVWKHVPQARVVLLWLDHHIDLCKEPCRAGWAPSACRLWKNDPVRPAQGRPPEHIPAQSLPFRHRLLWWYKKILLMAQMESLSIQSPNKGKQDWSHKPRLGKQ